MGMSKQVLRSPRQKAHTREMTALRVARRNYRPINITLSQIEDDIFYTRLDYARGYTGAGECQIYLLLILLKKETTT